MYEIFSFVFLRYTHELCRIDFLSNFNSIVNCSCALQRVLSQLKASFFSSIFKRVKTVKHNITITGFMKGYDKKIIACAEKTSAEQNAENRRTHQKLSSTFIIYVGT